MEVKKVIILEDCEFTSFKDVQWMLNYLRLESEKDNCPVDKELINRLYKDFNVLEDYMAELI